MPSQRPLLSPKDLHDLFRLKYLSNGRIGWGPKLRSAVNYFSPDDYYEATVAKLLRDDSLWVDLGCGRELFPSNHRLARVLADRCQLVVGVDPDATLEENRVVHERVNSSIEDFRPERQFSLATMRMVAEHITEPEKVGAALARLTRRHGKVVVFTVSKWAPVSVVARLVPFRLHHAVKRFLWKTEEKDTFPVAYRMNSRKQLRSVFEAYGFREVSFTYLDDCRLFTQFRVLHFLELGLWRLFTSLGLSYPERCLLGVYERVR